MVIILKRIFMSGEKIPSKLNLLYTLINFKLFMMMNFGELVENPPSDINTPTKFDVLIEGFLENIFRKYSMSAAGSFILKDSWMNNSFLPKVEK